MLPLPLNTHRHGSNSSEGNRGSGYNQVPLNQTSGQYQRQQRLAIR